MTSRQQFEEFVDSSFPFKKDRFHMFRDEYKSQFTRQLWEAWQAASKASEQQLAAVVAENAGLKEDGWITWSGGEQPVPDATTVTVIFADKDTDTDRASAFPGWIYFGDRGDIIAYRVHDESDEFAAQLRQGVEQ